MVLRREAGEGLGYSLQWGLQGGQEKTASKFSSVKCHGEGSWGVRNDGFLYFRRRFLEWVSVVVLGVDEQISCIKRGRPVTLSHIGPMRCSQEWCLGCE